MKKIAIIAGLAAVLIAFLTAAKPAEQRNVPQQNSEAMFTVSEVATHDSREDCYAIISGNVYNLTGWIANHPGGAEAILSLCGKDGTEQFMGQHGQSAQAKQALSQFLIGTVKE